MARPKAKTSPAKTDYVVLKRVSLAAAEGDTGPFAWATVPETSAEPQIFSVASKSQAIRQFTGEGADVLEGTFKAVPLSSWRGGETTKRVTASQRLPVED